MYFCPKCNYVFDISKKSNQIEYRIIIKKIPDLFKKIEQKEDLSKYKAEFKQSDLTKYLKYNKLSNEEKQNINKLFEEINFTDVEFKCNNCNYIQNINETIILYQYDINQKNINIKSLEENELICNNPILPRTHDYNCKNILCITNKQKINKEAVFYRDKDSFKINYICCICYYSW